MYDVLQGSILGPLFFDIDIYVMFLINSILILVAIIWQQSIYKGRIWEFSHKQIIKFV